MPALKGDDQRLPVHHADGVDRCDAYPSFHLLVQRLDLFLQGIIALHQLPAAFVVDLAFRRQRQRPPRPVDQPHPQAVLQSADDLARAGLRHPVRRGAVRKAPPAHHIAEHLQGLHMHGCGRRLLIKDTNTSAFLY